MTMKRSKLKRVTDEIPRHNYTRVPNELIHDSGLDWRAKSLAVHLWSLDCSDGGADISTHALAKALRMGHPKVLDAVRDLIAQSWLMRKENRGPNGGLYQYVYLIHPARRIPGSTAEPEHGDGSGSTAEPVTGSTAEPLTNKNSYGVFDSRDDGVLKEPVWVPVTAPLTSG